jgi:hypothetical protein
MRASHSLLARREIMASNIRSNPMASTRILLLLALIAAAILLLLFPPAQYSVYPQCPFHLYLGILCPGCGTTRALAALLHGDIGEALRLNSLTTIGIPLAILWRIFSRKPLALLQPTRAALGLIFAVVAAFTLVRNF